MSPLPFFFMTAILAMALYIRPADAADIAIPPPLPILDEQVSLDANFTRGVSLQEFTRLILEHVLHEPFILSHEFMMSDVRVGFLASELKRSGTEELLRTVLREHAFSLTRLKSGYVYVGRLQQTMESVQPEKMEDFVYRIRHRSLSYLSSQIRPIFSAGTLANQRSIDAPGIGTGPVDTGGSLFSAVSNDNADVIVYRGTSSEVERLKSLLALLDVPVSQVSVRALVVETGKSSSSGFSISALGEFLKSRLSLSLSGPSATHPNSLKFNGPKYEVVASTISGDGHFKVLTAPAIVAQSGATATLSVGNRVPTLGAIQMSDSGQTRQSVEYVSTGSILRITPTISAESVSISLTQELSDAVSTQTGVDGSPTITQRSLTTQLSFKSGEWAILGGLTSVRETDARDNLSFWQSFTTGRSKETSESDIVVMLYVEVI